MGGKSGTILNDAKYQIIHKDWRKYMIKFNTGTELRQNLQKIVKIGKNQLKKSQNQLKIMLFCSISMGVPFNLRKWGQPPYNPRYYAKKNSF